MRICGTDSDCRRDACRSECFARAALQARELHHPDLRVLPMPALRHVLHLYAEQQEPSTLWNRAPRLCRWTQEIQSRMSRLRLQPLSSNELAIFILLMTLSLRRTRVSSRETA
eukprot:3549454-Pleurochrysis_carterae.AAC.1